MDTPLTPETVQILYGGFLGFAEKSGMVQLGSVPLSSGGSSLNTDPEGEAAGYTLQ